MQCCTLYTGRFFCMDTVGNYTVCRIFIKLYVEVPHKTLLGKPEFHENRRNLILLVDVNEFLPALSADWRS